MMVVVLMEVPLAVVTVGRQSKSWSPSLSCCSGPWYVGQDSRPGFTAADSGSSRTVQSHNRIAVAVSRDGGVADGKGSVGDAQMVHDLPVQDPLPRSDIFRADLRDVSLRDDMLESGGVLLAVDAQG